MESRNLVTAREMVNSGNYLIPTMNGELRLEKPPLPTWIAAVEEETIRMEWVYEAGRSITPIDLKNDSAVYAALPFVLVSEKPAPDLLGNLEVTAEYLGTFDNNWQKPDSHRYNKSLTKEVYLVKKK